MICGAAAMLTYWREPPLSARAALSCPGTRTRYRSFKLAAGALRAHMRRQNRKQYNILRAHAKEARANCCRTANHNGYPHCGLHLSRVVRENKL